MQLRMAYMGKRTMLVEMAVQAFPSTLLNEARAVIVVLKMAMNHMCSEYDVDLYFLVEQHDDVSCKSINFLVAFVQD